MKSPKTKLTNRKFYNKWLYKVSIDLRGGGIFRDRSVAEVKEFCHGSEVIDRPYSILYASYKNKEQLLEVCEFLENFDNSIWATRIENRSVDFYTNDVNFYNSLSLRFNELVIHQFEPDPKTEEALKESDFTIVGKKLPHNRYNYRVYILPHKMKDDVEEKTKFLDWLEKQAPKIRCSAKVRDWFLYTKWNWDRRYVLVEDDATLLMLKLRNSEVVGRVYKYITSDK